MRNKKLQYIKLENLIVDQVELPKKLFFGQVLVKIKYSGICGSQINEIDAAKVLINICHIYWVMKDQDSRKNWTWC